MSKQPQNGRNSRIWPAHKAELDGSEVEARCVGCGLRWEIDKALAGFRLRCECGAWVEAPGLPASPELPRGAFASGLHYWHSDDSPSEPEFRVALAASPAKSKMPEPAPSGPAERRIKRSSLELFALFVIVAMPAFGLSALVQTSEVTWLPLFASSAVGALLLLPCGRKQRIGPTRMGRSTWKHLAEANLASYAGAASVLALAASGEAGHMLGAGFAPLLDNLGLWGTLLGVALLPAVLEEYAFRGALQGRMTQLFGVGSGIIISAMAFALAHGSTLHLPAYLLLGLYLAWLRNRSQSLAAPILMHFLFNGLLVMGQFFAWELPAVG